MYLIHIKSNDEIGLARVDDDAVPRYAILSHAWGAEDDEVTFTDLRLGTGKNKLGYEKIELCRKRAAIDNLQYFWIDTCCIDRSSAADLSESINSMFRFYQNATKCYALLTDVTTPWDDRNLNSEFRKSRWFSRGWTLQELIAPRCVEFFSHTHQLFGNKRSLERQIHEITKISVYALRGEPLERFSITERLSWVNGRRTKRKEDMAYCLLGIFDINMPAIYGEGERNAFRRLQDELLKRSKTLALEFPLWRDEPSLHTGRSDFSKKVPRWIVPLETNPRFTGREAETAWLEEKLLSNDHPSKLAITGLGGVGKMQLSLEVLSRIARKRPDYSMFWVTAADEESLYQSYLNLARQLELHGLEAKEQDVTLLVQEYLNSNAAGKWVLVFDNADDIGIWTTKPEYAQTVVGSTRRRHQALIECVPRSEQGTVIFTTRDKKTALRLAPHCVKTILEMDGEASTELLKNHLHEYNGHVPRQQHDAAILVAELAHLPLAIVQAAAYINQTSITIFEYLSLLSEQENEVVDLLSEDFDDDGRYRASKNPVMTTWLVSFEKIQKQDSLAAEYLSIMSCVEPKNIPQSLLPTAPTQKRLVDAMGVLMAYSFMTRILTEDGPVINIHRLVHLATRNWLSEKGLMNACLSRTLRCLSEVFPTSMHENRALWRSYLPHAMYAVTSAKQRQQTQGCTSLLEKVGMCLHRDGRYIEGQAILEETMVARTHELGTKHPAVFGTMNNLASVLRSQGKFEEAEQLMFQAVKGRAEVLGAEHSDTLFSMNSLGIILQQQGKLEAAEEVIRCVLEKRMEVLGAEHRETLFGMNSLAIVTRELGKYASAQRMFRQALKGRTKLLGPGHAETLSTMHNLSHVLRLQGNYTAAEELCRQTLGQRRSLLGFEHPLTLENTTALATILQEQSKSEEASELCQIAIEGQTKLLGPSHPSTIQSSVILARLRPPQHHEETCLHLLPEP